MTRFITILTASIAVSVANPTDSMEAKVYEKGGKSLPYRWTKTGDSEKPALVLFLHGAGERGDNNKSQLVHGISDLLKWLESNKESAVVVAPQCNRGVWWADLSGNFKDPNDGTLSKKPSDMLSMVFDVVDDLVKKNKVDPSRIYITGLSMGGYGTFGAVAHRPDFFAAAMPVCGGGDAKTAAKLKNVPFWVFHGDADSVVPVECSRVMAKAIKDSGGEVKLTEYPGVSHDSWSQTYRNPETWKWLFSQKKK